MLGLWAGMCLAGALYATWQGYGGRDFAATLTAFAFFFLVMLLFAARGVADGLASRFGPGSGIALGAAAFLAYLIYSLGTNTFGIARAGAVAFFVFAPLALAASAERKPAGAWQDFVLLAGVWVAVKFGPSNWVWPYPSARLAYVFTVLLALNVALAAFVLLRRVDGIGYSIGWGRRWGFSFLRHGRKNFSFAGCCKICWHVRARVIWRAGGRHRCFLGFRTSRTSGFRIGATSFSRPSPGFFTVGLGARQARFLRQRLCTRWWM